jgi:hypothetical protein
MCGTETFVPRPAPAKAGRADGIAVSARQAGLSATAMPHAEDARRIVLFRNPRTQVRELEGVTLI